ncbi:MAG: MBL fold metallo-hydrolase [Phycisphaerales bacterium]|nr:MBL fold metallo-hydrolase [Phycisphaerales bacterium]
MINVSYFGAAGEVTGSCYLVESGRARVLLDFGQHQGDPDSERRNRELPPLDPGRLDAVVLTHGHLDHCGRLPLLEAGGYKGRVFCTPATQALTGIILRDAAALQEADAEDDRKRATAEGRRSEEPLFTTEQAEQTLGRLTPVCYQREQRIAPGVSIRFFDAGHIIGAASVLMTVEGGRPGAATRRILFSGDVGVTGAPILRDPVVPSAELTGTPDLVVLESTYGDRNHRPLDQTIEELVGVLDTARAEDGKVLIPAFAVGRTQDLIYHMGCLRREDRIPPTSVYIDSPMATATSALYTEHPELYDAEAAALKLRGIDPLNFAGLRHTASRDESRALNSLRGGGVVIAGSGMCTGGRIVHHLRNSLANPSTHVVIVGYQGKGTLGRRLVEGAPSVRIFNQPVEVRAKVHTLGGFSAHAGQAELVAWGSHALRDGSSTRPRLVLTHGEDGPRRALAERIHRTTGIHAELPCWGDKTEL